MKRFCSRQEKEREEGIILKKLRELKREKRLRWDKGRDRGNKKRDEDEGRE